MPLAEAFVRSGKVRDLYRLDDERLLLVASDRLSAFDVVLPTPIPDKGRVLTGLSRFWFHETAHVVPNHLLSVDPADVPVSLTGGNPAAMDELRGRLMIGRTAEVLPIECVVRGFLSGSGWKEYRRQRGRVRHPAARRPARVGSPARRRSSPRPGRRPRASTTRTSPFDRVVELVGGAARGGAAAAVDPPVRAGGRGLREGGDHPRRHEVRVRRAARRRADPHRRGHDARQLALLERRRLPARPAAGELRQAVRPRLARDPAVAEDRARAGAARRRRCRHPPSATSRPTNESPGRASPAISRRT